MTPSANYDGVATRDTGVAKVLVGGGRTTGNVAVGLQRLDATTVNLPHTNIDETFTITVLPPTETPPPTGQRWTPASGGQLTVHGGTKCLDASGTANGTKVILWSCNGGSHQQWALREAFA